jgi:hypothetical protein
MYYGDAGCVRGTGPMANSISLASPVQLSTTSRTKNFV